MVRKNWLYINFIDQQNTIFFHHLGFEKHFWQMNCPQYLKLLVLILLMLIYLAIYSHFSIVYNSLFDFAKHSNPRTVISEVYFCSWIEFERLIVSICCVKTSFFDQFQWNQKISMPLQLLTIHYIKSCGLLLKH